MAKRSLADRFHEKYIVDENTGCWLWTASKNRLGYGMLMWWTNGRGDRKAISAHRCSYMIHKGDIPEGVSVCHKCDVRHCVNPDHLFLGTHAENMEDCRAKGRRPKGESNPAAKLTKQERDIVRKFLQLHPPTLKKKDFAWGSVLFLARWFDVSSTMIKRIFEGRVSY